MKKNVFIRLLPILFAAVFLLTACRGFDHAAYIQAMLDSIYKGEHARYADITHVSEETLALYYEDGINAEIEALIAYMNIAENSSFVNEETRSNAREMFKTIYQYSKYTVGEASDSGSVTVTIYPIDIYRLSDNALTAYHQAFAQRNENGEFAQTDDETFYSAYIQGAIDILNANISQIGYSDPHDVTVRVQTNEENIYSITEDEFLELDRYIIDYE